MNLPLVSICIPTYNAERTIAETLDSLLAQDYENIKINIFDNQSTDGTTDIINNYIKQNSNITLTIHPENIGGENNFTHCIQNGEGDFTAVFHSDDVYHQSIVSSQVRLLTSDNDIAAVAVHANQIDMNQKNIGERFLPSKWKQLDHVILSFMDLFDVSLKYGNIITCPSVMARTEIFKDKIKKWNGADFKTSADLDVWLRLANNGKFAIITQPLINYRVAEVSYSYNLKKLRTCRHDLFLVLDHYKKDLNLTEQQKSNYRFLEFKDLSLCMLNYLKRKNKESALEKPQMISPFDVDIIKSAFQDLWHIKYYLIGTIIYLYQASFSFFHF